MLSVVLVIVLLTWPSADIESLQNPEKKFRTPKKPQHTLTLSDRAIPPLTATIVDS